MAAVHEQEILARSLVRVRTRSGQVVGAGFLVAADTVATCAHVVAEAAGEPGVPDTPPDGPVRLDFPLLSGREARATVLTWRAEADVALLRLDAPVPGTRPVPPADGEGARLWQHPFRALGFPARSDGGVWATGTLRGTQGEGWVQMETDLPGQRIVPGFSGTPVWDAAQHGVVGMTVAADGAAGSTTAYLIPLGALLDPAVLPPRSPFRGLAPFTEADADVFHGREEETRHLLAAVARRPLTLVVGPSGSGKSSLVRAGLLPALRAAGTTVRELRAVPGTRPAAALARALVPVLEPEAGEVARLRATAELTQLLDTADGLPAALRDRVLAHAGEGGHVLFVDQLEEYATADPAAARALTRLLVALGAGQPGRPALRVVATARAESLDVLVTPDVADVLSDATRLLVPLSADGLLRAVTGPVAAVPGLWFEPGLPERIVADAGEEPGRMPLVEFALTRLWEAREAGTLTHTAYDAVGGVAGALVGYAEDALAELLRPGEESLARRLFVQLARPAADDSFARRPARTAELDPALAELARRLAPTKLVVLGTAGGEDTGPDGPAAETVELAHESLTTLWPRLHDWLTESRDFRAWQEQLRRDLTRWRDQDREPAALLRGSSLATALDRLVRHPEDVGEAERAYILLGDRQAKRGTRGLYAVIAFVAALALTAGGLAGWALYNNARYQGQLREQAGRLLAATAERREAAEPASAVQLALAARATDPSPDTYGALLRQYARGQFLTGSHPGLWPGAFKSMDVTPDGRTAVVVSTREDGTRAVSVVTGLDGDGPRSRPLWQVPAAALEDAGHSSTSELGPDGRTFALASGDGRVWLWGLSGTGPDAPPRVLTSADAAGRKVNGVHLDVSSDGRRLLRMLAFYDGKGAKSAQDRHAVLSAWDLTTGHRLPTAPGLLPGDTRYAAFTADPGQVVLLPDDEGGKTVVRELATGREVRSFDADYRNGMIASGGERLVVGGGRPSDPEDAPSRTFTTSGAPGRPVPLPPEVRGVPNPDRSGEFAVLAENLEKARRAEVTLVELRTGGLFRTRVPLPGAASATDLEQTVAVVPDGRDVRVLLPAGDTLLTARAAPVATLPGRSATPELVKGGPSPDGTLLARSGEGFVEVVDSATGRARRAPAQPGVDGVPFWTADSRWIVLGFADATVSAFSAADPRRRVAFDLGAWGTHARAVEAIEPMGGSEVAVLTGDGRLMLFDAATGRRIAPVVRAEQRTEADQSNRLLPTGQVRARPGRPDEAAVVVGTGTEAGRVELWNLRGGDRRRTLTLGALGYASELGGLPRLQFSADGRTLAALHGDGSVRFWDVETGHQTGRPLATADRFTRLIGFGPDGMFLTTGPEGDPRLWDLGTGLLLTDLPLPVGLGISLQGTRLLAAGDGWYQAVDLRPEEMAKALCRSGLDRDFTEAERALLPEGATRTPPCRAVGG
ncbi:trypsin-like peptidase domain-containing protein [Streptomyces sp. NPDC093111]|uniref:nSTAND1 domain-containing NTPase n=1 Tax=Streptomyces sp. NPDC093111 TaxID=3154978 RepID=UPI003444A512